MAAKKNTNAVAPGTKSDKFPRERFAGYPSVDAFEIQYEVQLDDKGKPAYEYKDKAKKEFRLDDEGKKIPVLDKSKPKRDKNDQELKKKAKKNSELPWGFTVKDTGERKTWKEGGKTVTYAACCRCKKGGFEQEPVWIREDSLQDNRCLEVVFVDIGQGDGCFLVTPDDKKMVIDAGQEDNMRHYLNWRYGSSKETEFEAAIISHPDSDHYQGFGKLFERDNFYFKTVYTNGLMEQFEPKQTGLGPVRTIDGVQYVTELVTSKKELVAFLANEKNWATKASARQRSEKKKKNGKQFPTMLNEALEGWKVVTRRPKGEEEYQMEIQDKTMGDFQMLSVDNKHLPGYEPKAGRDLTIQVLGPVPKTVDGKKMLEWLDSNVSKTKNGHSVVLRLQYKNVSMMLGGDLNIPSEELLLKHHTGLPLPKTPEEEEAFVSKARQVFQVDIAKSCHHGSSDFTHLFLQALNPMATVISSGDNEPHSHPRSDTLGAIGRYSRSSPRPLIFSTELARSTKDNRQKPWELRAEILKEVDEIAAAPSETAEQKLKKEELLKQLKKKLEVDIDRSVAVYGAITVVTDGEKVIIYQKLERKGSHGEYDMYCLEPTGENGTLMYQSKH